MAIGTGAVSMSDIRTEWGRSGAIKMSEMYRGGTHVRSKAANNNGTNLASTVPTSGVISIDDFRGTAKGFKYTFSGTATNQNASTLFGDDYSVDYPKEIVIDSGVELGATSTAEEALQIDSGASGTITVTNNGTLTGAGGAAGAAGGDAFQADVACIFINNGTIRSGGGGGGAGGNGGTGGGGTSTSTVYETRSSAAGRGYLRCCGGCGNGATAQFYWDVSVNLGSVFGSCGTNTRPGCPYTSTLCCRLSSGGWTYQYTPSGGGGCQGFNGIQRFQNQTVNTNGGAGGAGGAATVGQGYNQSAGSANAGAGGAAGGTNAGTGGTGGSSGAGGGYGTAGSNGNTGATGANGNRTNGSAGSGGASGGAAGAAIQGISNVTLTNNGTITGGQV